MKKITMLLISIALTFAWATVSFCQDVYVNGYTDRNGRWVQPHYRSRPDGNPWNNYGTYGNYNPYTAQPGVVIPIPQVQPRQQKPWQFKRKSYSQPSWNRGYKTPSRNPSSLRFKRRR